MNITQKHYRPMLSVAILLAAAVCAQVDGKQEKVSCEVIVSAAEWNIPDERKNERSPVVIALRITNTASEALLFSRVDTIQPILRRVSAQAYTLEGGRKATRQPSLADYRFLNPGESTTFRLDAHLYWQQGQLVLGGSNGFGGNWLFRGLQRGELEFAVRYIQNGNEDVTIRGTKGDSLTVNKEQVWKGDVTTAFVKVSLVP